MNLALVASAANETGHGVEPVAISSAGAIVGLLGVVLTAAWIAYLYR
jgi:hypothetical protein